MVMTDSKKKYAVMALFSLLIFAVYAQLLANDFINYDDQSYVTGNEYVQGGLTFDGIQWAFTTFHSYNWHPLTWLSHMLDVQLYGLNPAGHHLTNVVFHVANSLVLFVLLTRMTGTVWRSVCVAALFAVHPLHLESVAWIAERKDLLSTLFGFLAILAYLKFTRNRTIGRYLPVVALFALSLLAKPMLVTLPFLLLLLDYWPLQRFSPGRSDSALANARWQSFAQLVLEKVPLFALTIASCVVTYLVQSREGAVNYHTSLPVNSGNAILSYVKYVGKMFWPHPLAVIYPFNPDEINAWNVAGASLFLAGASFVLIRQAQRRPYLAVGWLWYLGTLVPVIGFVRVGDHSIADRYTYLPLVGLFIMVVWGINEVTERLHIKKAVVVGVFLAVITILSSLTIRQETYWLNSITLFEHAVAVTGDNSTAHKMLGLAYGAIGNVEKATSEGRISRMLYFRDLTKINPGDYAAHYMLANAYGELNDFDDAVKEYRISIRLNGNNSKAYNNLGIAYYKEGKIDDARQAFRMAVAIDPANKEASSNLNTMERQLYQQGH
jgi:protein O-mannosyl-transferase